MNLSNHGIDLSKYSVDRWSDDLFVANAIEVDVLRIDKIHPVISGNKWFKLKYTIERAINEGAVGIITQGGAFSNHLIATAYACKLHSLQSVGLVRGEPSDSPTLSDSKEFGMQLEFVNRDLYRQPGQLEAIARSKYPQYYWVAEGGQSEQGIRGAAEILSLLNIEIYTHIACAVGTGTMFAGLINRSLDHQHLIGIPVLKIKDPSNNELSSFLQSQCKKSNYELFYQFHGGGYGKIEPSLIGFMNELFLQQHIPTDRIYTAKLMKAIYSLAKEKWFPPKSRILVIHSGGLQGNRSLPKGALAFEYTGI